MNRVSVQIPVPSIGAFIFGSFNVICKDFTCNCILVSLVPLLRHDITMREKPIPFRFKKNGALVDNAFKLVTMDIKKDKCMLYNLKTDPKESNDISTDDPDIFNKMKAEFKKCSAEECLCVTTRVCLQVS